ncbi:MAG: DUF169 domain-containing protein [Desulfobulbaceae bacterium]|nr:DUF169 domain-containing protein [Desulfobulbaceae bacterium]
MQSEIAQAIKLQHQPVAFVLTEKPPEKAMRFAEGKWGCVMFLAANAARGKTAVISSNNFGCWGGGVGLGFGNRYKDFPGGKECFLRFLSSGNQDWEKGRAVGEMLMGKAGRDFASNFLEGEGYVKNPELTREWLDQLPITDVSPKSVVLMPLAEINPDDEQPESVTFFVNADQLSALVVLANYGRKGRENVAIPWAAACQNIGIMPLEEGRSAHPRAVVGLTDLSARKYVRKLLGEQYLSFAMPWQLFQAMEKDVPGSFLERHSWQSLLE